MRVGMQVFRAIFPAADLRRNVLKFLASVREPPLCGSYGFDLRRMYLAHLLGRLDLVVEDELPHFVGHVSTFLNAAATGLTSFFNPSVNGGSLDTNGTVQSWSLKIPSTAGPSKRLP